MASVLVEKKESEFRATYGAALQAIPALPEPVETLAPLILDATCSSGCRTSLWTTVLWHMAQHHGFWLEVLGVVPWAGRTSLLSTARTREWMAPACMVPHWHLWTGLLHDQPP